ncbi:hypothetical protein C0992_009182, partial [Termitomyces sp. T32_za158]
MIGLGMLAVIDIILLVDTELSIKDNMNRFQLTGEAQWTFGQTVALLLLLVALRDLGESILEKRAKQLDNQILEASENGEINSVESLWRLGERRGVREACIWGALANSHVDIALFLLDPENSKTKDKTGFQINASKDIVKVLQEYQDEVQDSEVKKGYVETVKDLLNHRGDVNIQ